MNGEKMTEKLIELGQQNSALFCSCFHSESGAQDAQDILISQRFDSASWGNVTAVVFHFFKAQIKARHVVETCCERIYPYVVEKKNAKFVVYA